MYLSLRSCLLAAAYSAALTLDEVQVCPQGTSSARHDVPSLLQTKRAHRSFCDQTPITEIQLPLPLVQEAINISQLEAGEGLHEVVGKDGVFMIVLERMPNRSRYASEQLHRVGIFPRLFPATDASCTSKEALRNGCLPRGDSWRHPLMPTPGTCAANPAKTGNGCVSPEEQATADSHRRALELALRRDADWTAIFEDDAVPVFPETGKWSTEFREAWAKIPAGVSMVRLSWCDSPVRQFEQPVMQNLTTGTFAVFYSGAWNGFIGGCTSAYMVHKLVIPHLLNLFPCCVALDACYEWDFASKADTTAPDSGARSHYMMMNMDAAGSVDYIHGRNGPSACGKPSSRNYDLQRRVGGVIMQDRCELPSTLHP